ncbi:hypothetical protein FHG87_019987 [Trinorchestia longiramus]|nr:hypothetical protein FHG87_019987 [Trinorchestia longiramus]
MYLCSSKLKKTSRCASVRSSTTSTWYIIAWEIALSILPSPLPSLSSSPSPVSLSSPQSQRSPPPVSLSPQSRRSPPPPPPSLSSSRTCEKVLFRSKHRSPCSGLLHSVFASQQLE